MAVYMPPIARKKRVPQKYNPDTFRVISVEAEEVHPRFSPPVIKPVYEKDTLPTRKLLPDIPIRQTRTVVKSISDFRAHNPQPRNCGFLCHNVRLLNEPIATVTTRDTQEDECNWWPHRISNEPHHIPEHTLDSTYRDDFVYESEKVPPGSNRHLANPNKDPALGAVPVNFLKGRDGKQRFFKEDISFQHIYNSRADPNYPFGLRREGAFVWKQMSPAQRQMFIEYHEKINEYCKTDIPSQRNRQDFEEVTETKYVSPRPSNKSGNNSVRLSVSEMSIPYHKKMTPAATPTVAASTGDLQHNSPQESIFYEKDIATQTSPNHSGGPSPSTIQPNVPCDTQTENSKPPDDIPSRTE
ncbi:uncharacterized protein LOC121371410 [Gigantopelta aegis]|uniref:uncharacterized protein LOC121371410 n=1 Tax=Gigantopelta aegis TaxID=1735272 RepID=UPI001B88D044|nr:uncharacterized protein LOC121371410 [Gigantopelta aegis]